MESPSPLSLPLNATMVEALARMTQTIGSADWFDSVPTVDCFNVGGLKTRRS